MLTELTVEATVAAEAGQWRWAWSTTTVAATLRRMRADLKRAFVAAEVAVVVAPESSEVRPRSTADRNLTCGRA